MGLLRRDLAGSEGLVAVVGDNPALLAVLLFHHLHFIPGNLRGTVDTTDIVLPLRLVVLGGVVHYVPEALQVPGGKGGVFRLVRVGGIAYHPAQIALDLPNGGGRHQIFSGSIAARSKVRISANRRCTVAEYSCASTAPCAWAV